MSLEFAWNLGVRELSKVSPEFFFMQFMARFKKHMRKVEIAIGSLLVVTGLLIFFGSINEVGQWLLETFPALGGVG